MTRRRLVAVLAAAAVALGGCGMPGQTKVHEDGPGLARGAAGDDDAGTPPPARLASRFNKLQFVRDYLTAPAGDLEGAAGRQSAFLAAGDRPAWRPPEGVNVVQLTEEPLITGSDVVLRVQHIGVLTGDGILAPPQEAATTYVFRVAPGEDENAGLFVSRPPQVILMSLDALDVYYEARSLYFWDTDLTGLVPDLRYLPRSVPRAQRPEIVLEWLVNGPSPWLQSAVQKLPAGTQAPGNVFVDEDGRLVVNLNAAAVADGNDQLDLLGFQLRWTLRPDSTQDLDLEIDDQSQRVFSDDRYVAANPASRLESPEQKFCVFNGQVRRLATPDGATDVPVADTVNRSVLAAAFARGGNGEQILGALVRQTRDDRAALVVGGGGNDFKQVGKPVEEMSRPTWLSGPAATGLVVADGRLYRFTRGQPTWSPVTLSGSSGRVTAVAAAPDGRRIAYVADGLLYAASLVRQGGDLKKVNTARPVPTPFTTVTAVAWSGQDRLVVAGRRSDNERTALYELSVDGGERREVVVDLGNTTVDHLVAYPEKPDTTAEDRRIMYEAISGGVRVSYELTSVPEEIKAAAVVGVELTPENLVIKPTAPFFLE
jgi:hypothetical protein